jgi:hypothetical protein
MVDTDEPFAGATPEPTGSDPSSHNEALVEAILNALAKSTKNPCPIVPVLLSVAFCVDPAIGDVICTYSVFIPLTVGVAVNVTTPVPAT